LYDIFISYSTKENHQADRLCEVLENAGISCWMAPRNVLKENKSNWPPSIAQAVRNARLMIILFSENSDSSNEVLREVTIASRHNVAVLTVNVDGSDMNNLEYHLCTTQMIELGSKSIEQTSTEILSAARAILGESKPNSIAAVRAEPLLDIYSASMDKIGTALRSGVHAEGLWHKTLHCWFVSDYNGRPAVWFQKRSKKKTDFPGLLDITAGRHLNEAETDREAVDRIVDELGVRVAFNEVDYLGVRTYTDHIKDFYNREFNSVYVFRNPYMLNDFKPNTDEVSGITIVDADDGLRLLEGGASDINAKGLTRKGRKWAIETVSVTASEFVPRSDGYYQKIFALAKEYLNGSKNLSI